MSLFQAYIAASTDDGYTIPGYGENPTYFYKASTEGKLGKTNTSLWSWLRWDNVDIPNGVTVDNGYIKFHASRTGSAANGQNFWFEQADDPLAPTTMTDLTVPGLWSLRRQ